MTARGIRAVREHLAKLPPSSSLTLAERRAQYDRAERVFPTPVEVSVEVVKTPERPAEWLSRRVSKPTRSCSTSTAGAT